MLFIHSFIEATCHPKLALLSRARLKSLSILSSLVLRRFSGNRVDSMLFLLQVVFADLVQLAGRSFSINPGLSTGALFLWRFELTTALSFNL